MGWGPRKYNRHVITVCPAGEEVNVVQCTRTRANRYRVSQYACHEGNYGIRGILAGARAKDKEAAAKQ